MKLLSFKSIRTHLTFWFLILTLLPLLIVLIITYFQRVEVIENRTINKLVAIRDLKVELVNMWLHERVSDMNTLSIDSELSNVKKLINKKVLDSDDESLKKTISDYLINYVTIHEVYQELFILNPENGKILISVNEHMEGLDKSKDDYFTLPMERNKLSIKNIYYSSTISDYSMAYSVPIYDSEENNDKIVGILVARVNLNTSLYRLLLDRVGLGNTGETLIVNEDVYALNKLKWYDDAPLQLQIVAEPAVKASRGGTGVIKSLDYRGEEVLAAYAFIPGVNWGFVCKQDLKELNSPIVELFRNFIIIFIITSLIISISVINISRSITKNIIAMNMVAKKMRGGDLSVRHEINSSDELGSLALEFNNMVDITESRLNIQKGISKVSKAMIGKPSMQDFGLSLLNKLTEVTGANICVFYILNESEKLYEHFVSIGGNKNIFESFDANNPEGDFGNAIASKRISHIKNIPEETIFKFKTITGTAIPNELITIPIVVEDSVIALISFAKLDRFSSDSLEILNQSWDSINISYSNLIASERTRVFAEHLSRINNQLELKSEELEKKTKEMKFQAEKLQVTSNEMKLQNIELEAQKKRVVTANKLKSEFLSNMSHELRTPLNSIMALSNILITEATIKLNKEQVNYLQIIERNGKRLLKLINNILDLSKIEAGKMDVKPESTSVVTLLRTIRENMLSITNKKGLTFSIDVPQQIPNIETDESRLYQVLVNIVGNAIKFTEKGTIDIFADYDASSVYINVSDTGIGISQDVLPHIFDEFRQADGSSSRQYEGTGLGLAIAKKMIDILGGNIKVESTPGIGTTFTLRIPTMWHEEFDRSSEDTKGLKNSSNRNTILVVDDDENAIQIITGYLNETGFDTLIASNGIDAINIANKYKLFAITLDILMPDMDGWEVLQKLKSNSHTCNIPVLIVTISDEKQTGLALGAVGYINKPIDKEILINEIIRLSKAPESVMIVDDNEVDLHQMKTVIEEENISTIIAKSGEECIKLLEKDIPSILVLDLLMPGTNGFEVLFKLRNSADTKDLPVIAITAKDLSKEEKLLLKENVTAIIAKSESSYQELCYEIKRILDNIKQTNLNDHKPTDSNKLTYDMPKIEKQINILIIEDNPDSMTTMKAILKDNYNLYESEDGEDGLNKVKTLNPDLILLDMSLPKLSGEKVIVKLKSNNTTNSIPVIAITAQAMIGDRERIMELGCDEYVSKPIDKAELLKKISDILKS
jgi:signal transduction histidine kinase/DNA-binding response OmpR family regulator/HAMP domain-containing protein